MKPAIRLLTLVAMLLAGAAASAVADTLDLDAATIAALNAAGV